MQNALAIRPIHYASVSGGKDSLYMMKIILENLFIKILTHFYKKYLDKL